MKKPYLYLLFFLLFAGLGFLREYFFVSLNNVLFMLYYQREGELPVPWVMRWALNFSYESLYFSKYLFTLLCTLMYFLLSYFCLRVLIHKVYFERLLFYAYLTFSIVAALSMLYAWFVKEKLNEDEYTLSRWLMGVLQSPVICLIVLASEKLYRPDEKTTKGE